MKLTIPSNMHYTLGVSSWREEPQQETLAVLTLPCKRHTHDISAKDSERNEWDFEIDSSAGLLNVIDLSSLHINDEQKQRFHKAMNFLDLKPKIRRLQVLGDHDKDGPILTREQRNSGPSREDVMATRARLDRRVKGECFDVSAASLTVLECNTTWLTLMQNLKNPSGQNC